MMKKIDEKEVNQLKQIYNHYIDKRSEVMKITNSKLKTILMMLYAKIILVKNR